MLRGSSPWQGLSHSIDFVGNKIITGASVTTGDVISSSVTRQGGGHPHKTAVTYHARRRSSAGSGVTLAASRDAPFPSYNTSLPRDSFHMVVFRHRGMRLHTLQRLFISPCVQVGVTCAARLALCKSDMRRGSQGGNVSVSLCEENRVRRSFFMQILPSLWAPKGRHV